MIGCCWDEICGNCDQVMGNHWGINHPGTFACSGQDGLYPSKAAEYGVFTKTGKHRLTWTDKDNVINYYNCEHKCQQCGNFH